MVANRLIVCTPQNRPGKHDGDEFAFEARSLQRRWGGELFELPQYPRHRRQQFAQVCAEHAGAKLGHFAYFGHGSPKSLVHWYTLGQAGQMADALALCMGDGCTVTLYSRLAGRQFAGHLAEALMRRGIAGCRVLSHWTAGHTTRNPHVTVSTSKGPGDYVISRDSEYWPAWVDALRTDYRFDFPLVSQSEVEQYLGRADDQVKVRSVLPEYVKNQV